MRKKKKKKRKLRPSHRKQIQTKIPKTLNPKHQQQELWKKPILGLYWLEVLKLEIMEVVATTVQGELAKMKLILDRGKIIKIYFFGVRGFMIGLILFLDTVLAIISHHHTKVLGKQIQLVVVST